MSTTYTPKQLLSDPTLFLSWLQNQPENQSWDMNNKHNCVFSDFLHSSGFPDATTHTTNVFMIGGFSFIFPEWAIEIQDAYLTEVQHMDTGGMHVTAWVPVRGIIRRVQHLLEQSNDWRNVCNDLFPRSNAERASADG